MIKDRSFVRSQIFHTPFLVGAGAGRRTYVASCPDVFSSGIRPRRSSGDGPISGVELEEFPSQPEIKSCQWVHRHHPRPSRPSLGVMVKWRVAASSGLEKLDGPEKRRRSLTLRISATCTRNIDSRPHRNDRRGSRPLIGPPF
ncbi:hypothetical protein EVAR_62748_1 [Eumeta japonica]|uniref:Uncharacterized protein n=1 Tax=Eumeta variegata TaxID=151549 RepID=A0A4C1Z9S0_EUMVA|nr:hypothetical protein EVAR_62748_1 [Eumeta japonica]